jgi:hypothetical protein
MTDTESVVRKFYSALSRGEAEAAIALLDPEVKWTEAERTPYYGGELTGPDTVVKTVFEPIGRDFECFAVTPQDFITQDDRTAALGLYTGHFHAGGELRAPFVHVWTVRSGRIVRFTQHTDSAAWADAILPAFAWLHCSHRNSSHE